MIGGETTITSCAPARTEALAEAVGAAAAGGETVLLTGELGAGKTAFVRGLARGLGIEPRKVRSPSYDILHVYRGGRCVLLHFDAYFVRSPDEFAQNGLDEELARGAVAAVEWGERFREALPRDVLRVRIAVTGEDERVLSAAADGPDGARLLEALRRAATRTGQNA